MAPGVLLALVCFAVAGLGAACATTQQDADAGMVVRDGSHGTVLWRGPVSYTVRAARAGVVERAIPLPGLGELHVGVGHDDSACRLVWSIQGLERLVLFEPERKACAEQDRGRICLHGARFRAPAGEEAGAGVPESLVVDGCADANDLLWSKVGGPAVATVGPRPWRERCVPLATRDGCDFVYLGREQVTVATPPAAPDGLVFRFDGERWRACFLEADSGPYTIRVRVADSCGHSESVLLRGHSSDLDD